MRSILIEDKGLDAADYSYSMPWKHDANCFNFKFPNETISKDQIAQIENMEDIKTLVIGCDLDDYRFIEEMTNLEQIYIYSGRNIRKLSFIKKLDHLNHLCISDSNIDSLDDVVTLLQKQKMQRAQEPDFFKQLNFCLNAICIESRNDLDVSVIGKAGEYTSEIIIRKLKG